MFVFFVFAVAMAKYSTIAPLFQHCGASAAVALAVPMPLNNTVTT